MSTDEVKDNPMCAGCHVKAATLQCPSCLKIPLLAQSRGSFFCSNECFKSVWNVHKLVHLAAERKYAPYGSIGKPMFRGELYPWPLSPLRKMPPGWKGVYPDYAKTGEPVSERRWPRNAIPVLTAEEERAMWKVGRLGRQMLDLGAQAIEVGVSTDEIDRIIHEAIVEADAYPSPLNYMGFPKSCCTSLNEVICHGIPDARPLVAGDILNIDVSVYLEGFHSDLNETYFVGEVDSDSKRLVYAARESLELSIDACKPGMAYRELGSIIETRAKKDNLSVVRNFCGHGVGRLFHGPPNVPHYANNKTFGVMKKGHAFTIEPMLNLGTVKEIMWPDNWTATTYDGSRSAQFEHTLLITDTGVEVLTLGEGLDGKDGRYFGSQYAPKYRHLDETASEKARREATEQTA
ncbi:methionyl aminopeptidase [Fonticula alba]|uniref:Methionine aminopeptidase n=1 Tax=Fonticula alba TaxID=691883 RepID=A0A058ZCM2_FONAL|nr:methionyl aminopeptidase [Fonticula alba]KCV72129.1 methionyl aminopeptidase [Fonticula alba]|eukprot:XP_009493707.1 methionyl aminopeptidase [Fonticula alba]